MAPLIAFVMLAFIEAVTVVGPPYPPNAIDGGTVVAVLHVSAGSVDRIDILQGDEPFVPPVQSALGRWRFKDSEAGNVLVVVNFRAPTLYSAGSPARKIAPARSVPGLAYPEKVIDPAYPPNSLAEGSVVLDLDLSETGSVSKARILQGLGSLTEACVSAVRKWLFIPARDKKGIATASKAYAVCVVRRPILSPQVPQ
jgi:hypothetical protein